MKDDYNGCALGISNECYRNEFKNEVMFYEIDTKEICEWDLELILSTFTNDCIMFESSSGFHFVSFGLDYSKIGCVKKAHELSKEVGGDYILGLKFDYLTLRISPKRINDEYNEIYKPAPTYYKILKYPEENSIISFEHLEVYSWLGLPKKIKHYYQEKCNVLKFQTRYFFYYTNN